MDYAMQNNSNTDVLCGKARNLFELMMSLVEADLQLHIESVSPSQSDLHVEESEKYPAFHKRKDEDLLYLVRM